MAGPPDDDPIPDESTESGEPSESENEPGEQDDPVTDDEPSIEAEDFEDTSAASSATAEKATQGGPGPDEQYCPSCGSIIKKQAEICPECGVRPTGTGSSNEKDRIAAGIFALLLGGIGVHKFYLGQTKMGILYLCFFWTGIPAIVGFIEGIIYLTKSDEEFQRRYVP
ncbi:NINE protein [Halopenitus sp. H-Gu1]|uniref:NINE protein n=1 Tax=Halopenitus sp. H-Gu1 TaxID=3242697 RepID=UPI00359DD1F9